MLEQNTISGLTTRPESEIHEGSYERSVTDGKTFDWNNSSKLFDIRCCAIEQYGPGKDENWPPIPTGRGINLQPPRARCVSLTVTMAVRARKEYLYFCGDTRSRIVKPRGVRSAAKTNTTRGRVPTVGNAIVTRCEAASDKFWNGEIAGKHRTQIRHD